MAAIYKYCGKDTADKVFLDEHLSLKFSFLSEYNDPYEFFLTVDFDKSPDELAYYLEMVNMQTSLLATCFSKTPINTPMWAHYGDNSEGFVIEIDEEALEKFLDELKIFNLLDDVSYKDTPDNGLEDLLKRAHQIGKPRYVDMLRRRLIGVAYFTKQTCWSYERERRLLLPPDKFDIDSSLKLFKFPLSIVTSIIVGNRASDDLKISLSEIADLISVDYYEMKPSKIVSHPFFVCRDGHTYIFNETAIIEHNPYCEECNEPLSDYEDRCSWCSITDDDMASAAMTNSFRMLHRYGLLGGYLEATRRIHRK